MCVETTRTTTTTTKMRSWKCRLDRWMSTTIPQSRPPQKILLRPSGWNTCRRYSSDTTGARILDSSIQYSNLILRLRRRRVLYNTVLQRHRGYGLVQYLKDRLALLHTAALRFSTSFIHSLITVNCQCSRAFAFVFVAVDTTKRNQRDSESAQMHVKTTSRF